ncbi:MAG: hypothetical protein II338_07725 [Bacteroidaceae bacterium]|nr:hypothetical protein [Bacteroidaceae bacterium]
MQTFTKSLPKAIHPFPALPKCDKMSVPAPAKSFESTTENPQCFPRKSAVLVEFSAVLAEISTSTADFTSKHSPKTPLHLPFFRKQQAQFQKMLESP